MPNDLQYTFAICVVLIAAVVAMVPLVISYQRRLRLERDLRQYDSLRRRENLLWKLAMKRRVRRLKHQPQESQRH